MTEHEYMPAPGGRLAIVPANATPEVRAYCALLIEEARDVCGWLWVREPSARLIAIVRDVWRECAPGWVHDDDVGMTAMIAHSAISHHLHQVGVELLDASRAAARRVLDARPDLATRTVLGFIGYDGASGVYTLDQLLATDGSCVATSQRHLDVDAFDEDIERYDMALVRGMPVERFIASLEAR